MENKGTASKFSKVFVSHSRFLTFFKINHGQQLKKTVVFREACRVLCDVNSHDLANDEGKRSIIPFLKMLHLSKPFT